MLSLLCRFAEDGPVAAVVDDLHLVDAASAKALVFAARRLAADPVVVLLGVRSPEGDDAVAGLPAMRIGGLDLASARELLYAAGGADIADDQLSALHRATAGNPLALLELHTADIDVAESVETGRRFGCRER
nr:hypothetical protein GCM10025699_00160 [Microbacterium flavescens]BFF12487.1 hypothetical protein GCM10025699_37900 [Microbacterium flavescens]